MKPAKLNIKVALSIALLAGLTFFLAAATKAKTESTPLGDSKETGLNSPQRMLIVYFSHTGNTKAVAEQIRLNLGGELFELAVANPYPKLHSEVDKQALKEFREDYRPELASEVSSFESYDFIFLGYPNWHTTMPMAFFTLLDRYDFTGKTIIPFTTHGGSRFGRSLEDIARLAPAAKVLPGFEISGRKVENSEENVRRWLTGSGWDGRPRG